MRRTKRFLTIILMGMLIAGCEGAAEVHFVEQQLAQIPGITLVRVWGNDDISETGKVNAEVLLQDGTPATLFGMGRGSFEGPSRIMVAELGSLSPVIERYECGGVYDRKNRAVKGITTAIALDVGPSSLYSGVLFRRFENVPDALSHPQDLVRVVGGLPRCPAYEEIRGERGAEHRVCVRDCPDRNVCRGRPQRPSHWKDADDPRGHDTCE